MHIKCVNKSLIQKGILLNIYVAFFLVQLHYQFTSLPNTICYIAYSVNSGSQGSSIIPKAVENKPGSQKSIRLNKHYNPVNYIGPQPIHFQPLQFFPTLLRQVSLPASVLDDAFLARPALRGPPSLS